MKKSMLLLVLGITALSLNATAIAQDDRNSDHDRDHRGSLRARLRASNEVPTVISSAKGDFRATIDWRAETIEYEVSYSGLDGAVTQSHIHVGQPFAAGGIMIWFCANPPITAAPAGTQLCPPAPATITGTVTAADVIGPLGQAVPLGSFADAVSAIRSGNAYVNVHSSSAPGGEIRGQIE
jgi:CHRD domain